MSDFSKYDVDEYKSQREKSDSFLRHHISPLSSSKSSPPKPSSSYSRIIDEDDLVALSDIERKFLAEFRSMDDKERERITSLINLIREDYS